MAFKELKERLEVVPSEVEDLIRSNKEYYKLSAFKVLTKGVSWLIVAVVVGILVFFLSFFLAVAAALAIGEFLDSYALGFVFMGLLFLLILLLVILLKKVIVDKPLLGKLSALYFDNDEAGKTVIHKREYE